VRRCTNSPSEYYVELRVGHHKYHDAEQVHTNPYLNITTIGDSDLDTTISPFHNITAVVTIQIKVRNRTTSRLLFLCNIFTTGMRYSVRFMSIPKLEDRRNCRHHDLGSAITAHCFSHFRHFQYMSARFYLPTPTKLGSNRCYNDTRYIISAT
jgi:hypothetical protein